MSGKAAKIRLTEGQTAILQQIIRSMTAPQRLVQRARLIVLAFGGMFNGSISGIIGLQRKQVGLWRQRWKQSFNALVAIECRESRAALRRAIEEVLGDAPRSGSFGKFTAEQVTQVLAVACEPADQSGRPINEWTGRELADELVQRGIVASISASQVNRYLAAAERVQSAHSVPLRGFCIVFALEEWVSYGDRQGTVSQEITVDGVPDTAELG